MTSTLGRTGREVLFRWQFQRLLPPVLFFTLAQFLLFGLPQILHAPANYLNPSSFDERGVQTVFLYPFCLMLALFLVHRLFGFLHEANSANLELAWPLGRSTFFWIQNLLLALLLLIPSLCALFQTCLAAFLCRAGWAAQVQILSEQAKFYLALLAFSFFLEFFYLLCGNSLNAVCLAGLCNAFWPILVAAGFGMAQAMLPGFVPPLTSGYASSYYGLFGQFSGGLPLSYSLLSPALSYYTLWNRRLLPFLYWIAFCLLFLALCALIFQRRPAENAESEIWKSPLYLPIRSLAAVCGGLLLGFLFSAVRGSATQNQGTLPALIVGILAGSFLLGLLLDLLLGRGHLGLKRSFLVSLAAWLILALPLGWLIAGGFGFSTRVPRKELLNRVELRVRNARGERLPSLRFTEKDSLDRFAEKLKAAFSPDLNGLELPRDIFSRERYCRNNPGQNAGSVFDLNWHENGHSVWRELMLYPEEDPILQSLWKEDPGFCLEDLLSRYGEGYFFYGKFEGDEQVSFVKNGQAPLSEELATVKKKFQQLQDKAPGALEGMFLALYRDYARRGETERRQLREKAPLSLRLIQDDISIYGKEGLEKHREARILEFPVTDDCYEFIKFLQQQALPDEADSVPWQSTLTDPAAEEPTTSPKP